MSRKDTGPPVLIDVYCPVCDGNACGVCKHTGRVAARMVVAEPLQFPGFHPSEIETSCDDELEEPGVADTVRPAAREDGDT